MRKQCGGKMANYKEINGRTVLHPGAYLRTVIDYEDLNILKVANDLNLKIDELNKLIEGDLDITEDMAKGLASITNVKKDTWVELQNIWDFKANGRKRKPDRYDIWLQIKENANDLLERYYNLRKEGFGEKEIIECDEYYVQELGENF